MKIKLCNVHKLAVANEGEERKPIFIPFGTWPYDDMISQTLDRPHAEGIAADLDKQIAAGEPGIPVYQGHPDVPEYAGKYPDKGAMGWVKKILVNEDGMECQIEWDRDPGKGFGWFSPYWIGEPASAEGSGAPSKKNIIIDGLTSIGLVNNPNIREFRLANEAQLEERKPMKPYELPQHIIDLANEYDESKHPRAEDGKWTSGAGSASGGNNGDSKRDDYAENLIKRTSAEGKSIVTGKHSPSQINKALGMLRDAHSARKSGFTGVGGSDKGDAADRKSIHAAAIKMGFKYNRATRQYE